MQVKNHVSTSSHTTNTHREISPVQRETTSSGPITVTWHFEKGDGFVKMTIDSDGNYSFAGEHKSKQPAKDFDVALGLKNSHGHVILFHHVADASKGVQWRKHGQSEYLKSHFAGFSKEHHWCGEYDVRDATEGKRQEYEARQKKKEELKRHVFDAHEKHEDQLEKKIQAELKQIREEEIAEVKKAAQHHDGRPGFWATAGHVLNEIENGTAKGAKIAQNVAGIAKSGASVASSVASAAHSVESTVVSVGETVAEVGAIVAMF